MTVTVKLSGTVRFPLNSFSTSASSSSVGVKETLPREKPHPLTHTHTLTHTLTGGLWRAEGGATVSVSNS